MGLFPTVDYFNGTYTGQAQRVIGAVDSSEGRGGCGGGGGRDYSDEIGSVCC